MPFFDSRAIPPSGMYELPELPPGQYPYHCTLHPIIQGTGVVTGQNSHLQRPDPEEQKQAA